MNAGEINAAFDLLSYVSEIVSLHKSGEYFIGPCPICGGRDRFNLKRTDGGDVWICRKCSPDKYHSVIDFLMAYHNEKFIDALKRAGGEIQQPRRPIGNGKPVRAPAPVQVIPSEEWQAKAWKRIDRANSLLIRKGGRPARGYLARRGISRGSIYMHLLGYDPAKLCTETGTRRPAIVIPWLDRGNIVTAVKYRFIDQLGMTDKNSRYTSLKDGKPDLFGCQHILDSDDTLLFVEGELNAISVLQTLPRGVSVVSAGSERNGDSSSLQGLAHHYDSVVIWTDAPDSARAIRERMNRPDARILKSPEIDHEKWDANRMLQAGLLMEFIRLEFSTECLGIPAPAVFRNSNVHDGAEGAP